MDRPKKWWWVVGVVVPLAVAGIAILPDMLQRLADGTPAGAARIKPQHLSLDTPPITDEWALSLTELTYDYADAEKAGRSIADFRVSYLRTPPFSTNTPPFQWQLSAVAYDLDSPAGGFLVPRDGPRVPLVAYAGSASLLVFTVPPANQGDYLVAIVLLSSKATVILGEPRDLVTSIVK